MTHGVATCTADKGLLLSLRGKQGSAPLFSGVMRSQMIPLGTAAELVGIGKNTSYKIAKRGELCAGVPIVKVGDVYKVPVAPLEAVLGVDLGDICTACGDARGGTMPRLQPAP